MSDFDQQPISPISILQALLLCCSILMCSVTWSEATTAMDESAEAVVLGKIVKDQQTAQNQTSIEKNTEITPQQAKIANDMAEGESIRGLPTLNEPVVDQANLLSASQKQEIIQRILKNKP